MQDIGVRVTWEPPYSPKNIVERNLQGFDLGRCDIPPP